MKCKPEHLVLVSRVIESKGFIVRRFLTNSRKNLDCHLRLPDDEKFSQEQLDEEDKEFKEFLDRIFS